MPLNKETKMNLKSKYQFRTNNLGNIITPLISIIAFLLQELNNPRRLVYHKIKNPNKTNTILYFHRWFLTNFIFMFYPYFVTTYCPVVTELFIFYLICHHHHHQVVPPARISLTLSRHFSLSFIASGRSSGLHPVSSHSCCMHVRAARPAFAWP